MNQPSDPVRFSININDETSSDWNLVSFNYVDPDGAPWKVQNPPQTMSARTAPNVQGSIQRMLPYNCGMGPLNLKYVLSDGKGSTFGVQVIVPEQYRDLGQSPYHQITVNGTDWYSPSPDDMGYSAVNLGSYQIIVSALGGTRKMLDVSADIAMAPPGQPQPPQQPQEPQKPVEPQSPQRLQQPQQSQESQDVHESPFEKAAKALADGPDPLHLRTGGRIP